MHLFVISVTLLCNANLIKGRIWVLPASTEKRPLAQTPFQRRHFAGPALQRKCCVAADYFNKSSRLNSLKADANVVLLWGEKPLKRQLSRGLEPCLLPVKLHCLLLGEFFYEWGRFFFFLLFGKQTRLKKFRVSH